MKHIVQFSGGKDSTAMLLLMVQRQMKIDEIIFCDTGMEFPALYEHIAKVEAFIKHKVTVLKSPKTFEYLMTEHMKTKGKYIGLKGYGWPSMMNRWCTARLKVEPAQRYLRGVGEYTSYIGIAADELKRHKNIARNIRHPLYDWGITEAEALQYCYDKGFDFGGLYDDFKRLGCYLCPLQRVSGWRLLRKKYPKLYEHALMLDGAKTDYKKLFDLAKLEQRFAAEDLQEVLF